MSEIRLTASSFYKYLQACEVQFYIARRGRTIFFLKGGGGRGEGGGFRGYEGGSVVAKRVCRETIENWPPVRWDHYENTEPGEGGN